MPPPGNNLAPAPLPKEEALLEIVWKTACTAVLRAFLVLLLGGIAVDLVGGIFQQMTPTAPPARPQLEADPNQSPPRPISSHVQWPFVRQHQLVMLSAVFFSFGLWRRLSVQAAGGAGFGLTRGEKILKQVSDNWFSLVVGNAFGAMISAMILAWMQQFSWSQFCWHWLMQTLRPAVESVGRLLLGSGDLAQIESLWSWYGNNQFRFAFWFFYLAAIANDLGLPNFKALGRWLGRRVRQRRQQARALAQG